MNRFFHFLSVSISLLAVILLMFSNASQSQQIYKWTDKNGKVHYSDHPVDESAETLEVGKEISPEEQRKAREQAQKIIRMQQKRVGIELENAQEEKQAKEKKDREINKKCTEARKAVTILEYQARIVETDAKGNQRFIEDDERQKDLKQLREFISENCS